MKSLVVLACAVVAQTSGSAVATNPAGPISLRDAVSLALTQSPDLRAFDAGRRAAEALVLQVGRLPNPVVSTTVEDIGRPNRASSAAGVVQVQTTVQLSQLVELGGKRAARQRVAELDRDLASWDYEAARLDVLTRVTGAFLEVLAAQELVAHTVATLDVAERVRQTVGARVAAGVVSPIEETRAEVIAATARMEADRAQRTLEARRRQLATHWGSTTAAFASATGDLSAVSEIPPFAAIEAALVRNPDLARWTDEVERRRAALALARSARVPDVTVSAGYRRFSGIDSDALVVGASVPLPWFDRNRDGIRAAAASLDQANEAARTAALEAVARIADAYRALTSARDDVMTLRTAVVPGARSVFDAVQEGYQLGRFGLMDVLDAQRTLTDVNGRYIQALTSYHSALTTIERLVGPLTALAPGLK